MIYSVTYVLIFEKEYSTNKNNANKVRFISYIVKYFQKTIFEHENKHKT